MNELLMLESMDLASTVIAILTGGTLTGAVGTIAAIRYRKENKRLKESEAKTAEMGAKKIEADALTEYGGAMQQLLTNIKTQQELFERSMAEKDVLLNQQKNLIDQYRTELEEANRKIKTFEYLVSENKRKVEGVQKEHDIVVKKVISLEEELNDVKIERDKYKNIECTVFKCKDRVPPLKSNAS